MIKTTEMSSRGRFLASLICMLLAAPAFAADKPSPSPDTPSPFVDRVASFRDDRIRTASVGRIARTRHPSSTGDDRRARQLRPQARVRVPGQRQLRHLGLCRAKRRRLALWQRRSCDWRRDHSWRRLRPGRQQIHISYSWRSRSQGDGGGGGEAAIAARLVARFEFERQFALERAAGAACPGPRYRAGALCRAARPD